MPIGSISPFRPTGTVSLMATTTASNIALSGGGDTVVATNPSTSLIFVRFGSDATVTVTNSDMPVLPNSRVVLAVNSLISYVSAMSSSGSGTILFSRGDGSFV
jgi:hypothetical protein